MIGTTLLRIAVLGSASLTACWSQVLPAPLDFTRSNAEGIRLYSVSGFFGYSAFDVPPPELGSATLYAPPRGTYGASVSGGWQRFHGRTNFSIRYTGVFTGFSGGTLGQNNNRFGHNVILTFARPLSRKWRADVSASVEDAIIDQFIFVPNALASTSQTPATFDDLAAAMSVGQFGSTQSSVLMNGTSMGISPTRAVLLGSHVLTYGMRAGLSYAPSARWTFRLGSFAMGGQHRSGGSEAALQQSYILPRSVGGDASLSASFLATRRTSLDFSITETYISTQFQKSSIASGTVGVARKMSRHWFLRGFIGGSWVARETGGAAAKGQTIGGGSIGFTTYGNTFLATYMRSAYDLNLGAVSASSTFSGAWNWRRPRDNWGVYASYTQTQTGSASLASFSGWQASCGFTQRLPGNLFFMTDYTHLSSRGAYLNVPNHVVVDGVRLTVGWAPNRIGRNGGAAADRDDQ